MGLLLLLFACETISNTSAENAYWAALEQHNCSAECLEDEDALYADEAECRAAMRELDAEIDLCYSQSIEQVEDCTESLEEQLERGAAPFCGDVPSGTCSYEALTCRE